MKTGVYLIIGLLFVASVHAIALSEPRTKDIIFKPNMEVTFPYILSNSGSGTLKVSVSVSAGILTDYLHDLQEFYIIPPKKSITIPIKLTLPQSLPQGAYPITTSFSEDKPTRGMSATTGIRNTVKIVNPFEKGYFYGSMDARTTQSLGKPIAFGISAQNIGKTHLNLRPAARLILKGVSVKETKADLLSLRLLERGYSTGKIDSEGLQQGTYILEVDVQDAILRKNIAIGKPKIGVTIPELYADEENEIEIVISLDDWETPVENALITLGVGRLAKETSVRQTLYPGNNTVPLTINVIKVKSGTYSGKLKINGKNAYTNTGFNAKINGPLFASGPQPGMAIKAPEEESDGISLLLIVVLALSLVIFAFALGKYFGGRRN